MSYHTQDDDSQVYAIFAYPIYSPSLGGINDYIGKVRIEDVSETTLDDRRELIIEGINDLLDFEAHYEGQVVGVSNGELCEVATFETECVYWISECQYKVREIKWL